MRTQNNRHNARYPVSYIAHLPVGLLARATTPNADTHTYTHIQGSITNNSRVVTRAPAYAYNTRTHTHTVNASQWQNDAKTRHTHTHKQTKKHKYKGTTVTAAVNRWQQNHN